METAAICACVKLKNLYCKKFLHPNIKKLVIIDSITIYEL